MRLKNFRVENYKSIRSGGFQFSRNNILIGKNNSGKSNFIESLMAFKEALVDNSFDNFDERVTDREEDNTIVFRAEFSINDDEREDLLETVKDSTNNESWQNKIQALKVDGYPETIGYNVSIEGNNNISTEMFIDTDDGMQSLDSSNHYQGLGGRTDNLKRAFRSEIPSLIKEEVKGWDKLESYRKAENPPYNAQETNRLLTDGRNLGQRLFTLYNNHPQILNKISEEYSRIVDDAEEINTELSGNRSDFVIGEDEFDSKFNLTEISSGSEQLLILVTHLIDGAASDDLIIIEEPETYLHPAAQRDIFKLVKEVVDDDTQVLISTHSNVFVDLNPLTSVISVTRNPYTKLNPVNENETQSLLLSLGFQKSDLLMKEGVLFVEGQSDLPIFSEFMAKLGLDLTENGIHIESVNGKDEILKHGDRYVKVLDKFNIPFYIVIDSHGNSPQDVVDEIKENTDIEENRIKALKEYGIEDYLVDDFDAIAQSFNLDVEDIEDEADDEVDGKWLQDFIDDNPNCGSYDKVSDGTAIANNFSSAKVREEIKETKAELEEKLNISQMN